MESQRFKFWNSTKRASRKLKKVKTAYEIHKNEEKFETDYKTVIEKIKRREDRKPTEEYTKFDIDDVVLDDKVCKLMRTKSFSACTVFTHNKHTQSRHTFLK